MEYNVTEIDRFKVKELMAKKEIGTFQELADNLGISKTQISNILSSKFVPIKSNVVKIALFFDVSPIDIIKEKHKDKKRS
jgi:DNA (cytosine-5)-methyltransferase 1